MKKFERTLATIALCIGVILTAAGCQHKEESAGNIFYSEMKSVNKLVLAQMAVSKMATIDDLKLSDAQGLKQTVEAVGDALKIGSRKAAYSYNTYLRAYIDLSTLNPEDVKIDDTSKTIDIDLPEIQTEVQGRDPGIKEEHYRITGLRSKIDPEERASIKEKMNTAVKKEIQENPEFRNRLVAQAKSKAITYFQEMGQQIGYNVNVNFK